MKQAIETQLSVEWADMQKAAVAARVNEEQAIKTGFLERLKSAKETLLEEDRASRATKPLNERIKETVGIQLSDNWYQIEEIDRAMRKVNEHKKNEPVTHLSPLTSVILDQQRRDAERIANGKSMANAVGELALSREEWVNAQAEKRIDAADTLMPAEKAAAISEVVVRQLDARRDQRLDALTAQVIESRWISVKNSVLEVMDSSTAALAIARTNPADPLAAVDRSLPLGPRVEPEVAAPPMTREGLQPTVAVVARAEIVKEAVAQFTPEQETELLSTDVLDTWSRADVSDLQAVRDVSQQDHTAQVMAENVSNTPAYAEALTRVAPDIAERLAPAVEGNAETPAKTFDTGAFDRAAGKALVEALTSNHRDEAYAKWARLDTTNLNDAIDPDHKDQIYNVIVDNTRDPDYKMALSDVDFGLSVRASRTANEEDRLAQSAARLPDAKATERTIERLQAPETKEGPETANQARSPIAAEVAVPPAPSVGAAETSEAPPKQAIAEATPVDSRPEKDVTASEVPVSRGATQAVPVGELASASDLNATRAAIAPVEMNTIERDDLAPEPAIAQRPRIDPGSDNANKRKAEEDLAKRGTSARLIDALTRPFRSAGKTGNEMEAPAVMIKSGYSVPAAIESRYTVQDGDYWRFGSAKDTQSGDHQPAFRDHGPRLATAADDRGTVADMVAVAQAKGWQSVKLKGTEEFRRAAWVEASLAGIQTKGFEPQAQDRAMLDAARREREALTISRGKAPEVSATPSVQPKSAQTVAAVEPAPLPILAKPDVLVAHGHAPYMHDTKNSDSYFVTVRDQAGQEKTSWGVDLERAIDVAKVQPGDAISLENLGAQQVTVQAPIKNEQGKTVGYEEKLARRNIWEVTKEASQSPAQPERAAAVLMDVNALRKQVEDAIAGQPDNVRRAVMDRFAERLQAGLDVQAEHSRAAAAPAELQPRIEAQVKQVDAERVARTAIEQAAVKRDAPAPEVAQRGAPTMTP